MEAIREIKKVKNHQVIVDLPARFKNVEVEVIILPVGVQQVTLNGKRELLMTSESSLKKDWNLPQEDKAWQNL
jgi:hypothetical protein